MHFSAVFPWGPLPKALGKIRRWKNREKIFLVFAFLLFYRLQLISSQNLWLASLSISFYFDDVLSSYCLKLFQVKKRISFVRLNLIAYNQTKLWKRGIDVKGSKCSRCSLYCKSKNACCIKILKVQKYCSSDLSVVFVNLHGKKCFFFFILQTKIVQIIFVY